MIVQIIVPNAKEDLRNYVRWKEKVSDVYVRIVVNKDVVEQPKPEHTWVETLEDGSILIHRKDGKKVRMNLP